MNLFDYIPIFPDVRNKFIEFKMIVCNPLYNKRNLLLTKHNPAFRNTKS